MLKAYAQPFVELCALLADVRAELAGDLEADIGEGASSHARDIARTALSELRFHAKALDLKEVQFQISSLLQAWEMGYDPTQEFRPLQLIERLQVLQETLAITFITENSFMSNVPNSMS